MVGEYDAATGTWMDQYQQTTNEDLIDPSQAMADEMAAGPINVPLIEEPPTIEPDINQLILTASQRTGLPERVIRTLMAQESSFKPGAVNPESGATGLMQLMPETFEKFKPPEGGVISDPYSNVYAGTGYLKYLVDKYGSGGEIDPATLAKLYYGGENRRNWGPRTAKYAVDMTGPNRWGPGQVTLETVMANRPQPSVLARGTEATLTNPTPSVELGATPQPEFTEEDSPIMSAIAKYYAAALNKNPLGSALLPQTTILDTIVGDPIRSLAEKYAPKVGAIAKKGANVAIGVAKKGLGPLGELIPKIPEGEPTTTAAAPWFIEEPSQFERRVADEYPETAAIREGNVIPRIQEGYGGSPIIAQIEAPPTVTEPTQGPPAPTPSEKLEALYGSRGGQGGVTGVEALEVPPRPDMMVELNRLFEKYYPKELTPRPGYQSRFGGPEGLIEGAFANAFLLAAGYDPLKVRELQMGKALQAWEKENAFNKERAEKLLDFSLKGLEWKMKDVDLKRSKMAEYLQNMANNNEKMYEDPGWNEKVAQLYEMSPEMAKKFVKANTVDGKVNLIKPSYEVESYKKYQMAKSFLPLMQIATPGATIADSLNFVLTNNMPDVAKRLEQERLVAMQTALKEHGPTSPEYLKAKAVYLEAESFKNLVKNNAIQISALAEQYRKEAASLPDGETKSNLLAVAQGLDVQALTGNATLAAEALKRVPTAVQKAQIEKYTAEAEKARRGKEEKSISGTLRTGMNKANQEMWQVITMNSDLRNKTLKQLPEMYKNAAGYMYSMAAQGYKEWAEKVKKMENVKVPNLEGLTIAQVEAMLNQIVTEVK